jgi:peptidylamidoglycolate lyase
MLLAYMAQPLKKGTGIDDTIKYELVKDWPNLPGDLKLGEPTGLGIDTSENIVVFHRAGRKWPLLGSMPDNPIQQKTILILDRKMGKPIKSWGENLFIMPHGLTIDKENNIWVTDVGLHQVFKFDYEGRLLLKLGEAKVSGRDSTHFNKPTDIAVANDGSFYISDGYGNSRIIKFSADGKYLFEWGTKGSKDGQFKIPHAICLSKEGNVYVADRENERIQVFDSSGKFIKKFTGSNYGAMCSVALGKSSDKIFAVDDLSFIKIKHRGSDVFLFNKEGVVLTRFGRSGSYNGKTSWYHDLTIDSDETIYIGYILRNTLQKFQKISTTR